MAPGERWIESRIPIRAEDLRELTNEPVPNHLKRWWFVLGGTPAYLFTVQIATGILLAFYYQSAADSAYESVRHITNEVSYGWFIRGLHKWGATLMIASMILHQMRVYFTAAYRKPRELNWMVGIFMLLCVMMIGFTGYSLVYEQLSYWGTTVVSNLMDSVPVIGGVLKNLLLGGSTYNDFTLSRLFILHAAVLPVALVLLLVIHISLVRLLGVTELQFEGDAEKKETHFNFFPDHLMTELMIGLGLMILLSVLATVFPAEMGPRADPLTTPEVIKPEWYFYVTFRWLKLMSVSAAVTSMGFIVFTMVVWPFVDTLICKFTRAQNAHVWIGIVAVLVIIGFTVWEAMVAH